jgi:hypothetical protein
LGRRRLGIGVIVVGDQPDLNTERPMLLSQDQHDDDDEENEADEASADVDTRCEQHAIGTTQWGDRANRHLMWFVVVTRLIVWTGG